VTPVPTGTPAGTHRAGTHPASTHPARRWVPRRGSVAESGKGFDWLSTGHELPSPTMTGPATDPTEAAQSAVARPPTFVARPPTARAAPSTAVAASRTAMAASRTAVAAVPAGGMVVVAGLAFLLARPALGELPLAVPLLAAGYLALGAAALAVREAGGDRALGRRHGGSRSGLGLRPAGAPLGWAVPLGLGVVGVVGAGVVAGPVADRRVGAVAAGLTLIAAVAEEALFRRLLYGRLLRFGVPVAVLGSAALFALVHLPAYGLAAMPVDLGAALLLSWQRYASGRWTVPAVTHAVANLLAVT
jgi:membrane protease YdiL (CAAX protease family)